MTVPRWSSSSPTLPDPCACRCWRGAATSSSPGKIRADPQGGMACQRLHAYNYPCASVAHCHQQRATSTIVAFVELVAGQSVFTGWLGWPCMWGFPTAATSQIPFWIALDFCRATLPLGRSVRCSRCQSSLLPLPSPTPPPPAGCCVPGLPSPSAAGRARRSRRPDQRSRSCIAQSRATSSSGAQHPVMVMTMMMHVRALAILRVRARAGGRLVVGCALTGCAWPPRPRKACPEGVASAVPRCMGSHVTCGDAASLLM